MWSLLNLQKFKASILWVKVQELQARTLLWDAEPAPLCVQDKSEAELPRTPKWSGVQVSQFHMHRAVISVH